MGALVNLNPQSVSSLVFFTFFYDSLALLLIFGILVNFRTDFSIRSFRFQKTALEYRDICLQISFVILMVIRLRRFVTSSRGLILEPLLFSMFNPILHLRFISFCAL